MNSFFFFLSQCPHPSEQLNVRVVNKNNTKGYIAELDHIIGTQSRLMKFKLIIINWLSHKENGSDYQTMGGGGMWHEPSNNEELKGRGEETEGER